MRFTYFLQLNKNELFLYKKVYKPYDLNFVYDDTSSVCIVGMEVIQTFSFYLVENAKCCGTIFRYNISNF